MDNSEQFKKAVIVSKKLKETPTNDEMLVLYKFYKQATVGDNNKEQPSFLNFKEKSKWNAWNETKGMNKYDSEVEYIKTVNSYIKKYGVKK